MILADVELAAIAILAWLLGVFSMALWQNWRARPAPPIPPQWVPRSLSEEMAAVERAEGVNQDDSRRVRLTHPESPYAPKPKPAAQPLRARANKLKHWPRAFPEVEKPPAIVEALPRQVEPPARSIEPWHARDDLPKIEFGSGAKP